MSTWIGGHAAGIMIHASQHSSRRALCTTISSRRARPAGPPACPTFEWIKSARARPKGTAARQNASNPTPASTTPPTVAACSLRRMRGRPPPVRRLPSLLLLRARWARRGLNHRRRRPLRIRRRLRATRRRRPRHPRDCPTPAAPRACRRSCRIRRGAQGSHLPTRTASVRQQQRPGLGRGL